MKNSYRELLNELQEIAARDRLPLETVEQDYAISYLLAAIAQTPELSETLVFRGGTALRKCYFEGYRYSKDLDYSVRGLLPLEKYNHTLSQVANKTRELLNQLHPANRFDVAVKLVVNRDAHEDNQDTHKFTVKFPWHLQQKSGRAGRAVKLDTSHNEPVLLIPERRAIIHPYSQPLIAQVTCCSLEEIIAEKFVAMRAVALQREKQERVFTRPRDYYDVTHALHHDSFKNTPVFLAAIVAKAERRGFEIRSIEDLISASAKAGLERDWEPFLGDVVPNLSSCDSMLKQLEARLNEMFPDLPKQLEASFEKAKDYPDLANAP